MDKTTQRMKIIEYCKQHGSITIRDAFIKLHINSPSKRISEIRNSGKYVVDSNDESKINTDGSITRWKRYRINEI